MSKRYALIVDDNADVRDIISLTLNRFGFDVGTAGDGMEALESIEKRLPDLLLLDLMMPNKNGFHVLRQLREAPDTRKIPVIVISSVSDESMLSIPGVRGVLPKTHFSVKELKAQVDEIFAETKQEAT